MQNQMTFLQFKEYITARNSGKLIIPAPYKESAEIKINLRDIYEIVIEPPFLKTQLNPEEIEAICLFGSCLYRHFPKRYEKSFLKKEKVPSDIDLMAILKRGIIGGKLVVFKRNQPWEKYMKKDSSISFKRLFDLLSRKSSEQIPFSSYEEKSKKPLHISYHSVEQFINGAQTGKDLISESVIRYGLPIIGQERFDEITKEITNPRREPLYNIEWAENLEGKIQCKIF